LNFVYYVNLRNRRIERSNQSLPTFLSNIFSSQYEVHVVLSLTQLCFKEKKH